MTRRSDPITLLRAIDAGAAAAFLAPAIAGADAEELPALADAAIELDADAPIDAMLERYHELGPFAAEAARRLRRPAARLRSAMARRGAKPLLALVVERGDPELAFVPARVLAETVDPLDPIVARAAHLLRAMAIEAFGAHGRARPDARIAEALDAAIAEALESFRRHRRREVAIAAALRCGRAGAPLRELLEGEAIRIVRTACAAVDDDEVAAGLLRWCGEPRLATAAAGRLAEVALRPNGARRLLHEPHLLHAPGRRAALRGVERPRRLIPEAGQVASMAPEAQTALPLLARRLDLGVAGRLALLEAAAAAPAPLARARVVLESGTRRTADVAPLLDRLADDPSGIVSRLANRAGGRGRVPSADPTTRRLALVGPARASLAGLDAAWERLGAADRHAIAALHRDRAAEPLAAMLGERLRRGSRAERLEVLALLRRLRLVAPVARRVGRLALHPDAFVASAAVALLGTGPLDLDSEPVEAALDHPHPRVRANAVEALARLRAGAPGLVASLEGWTESDENRARGNAARALVRLDPKRGIAAVQALLGDRDPVHRVTGVWAARAGRASAVRRTLVGLSAEDPVAIIRVRAAAAARMLGEPEPAAGAASP